MSSPRMWGCFHGLSLFFRGRCVFPTHVGVFLLGTLMFLRCMRLPHACGGVSGTHLSEIKSRQSSPRMWGCFSEPAEALGHNCVFPTHVGVFPNAFGANSMNAGLPHACGGVSATQVFLQLFR